MSFNTFISDLHIDEGDSFVLTAHLAIAEILSQLQRWMGILCIIATSLIVM